MTNSNKTYRGKAELKSGEGKGVFLVTTKKTRLFPLNAFTAWTRIREFQLFHEGVSEVSEQAHEWSKRTNVASGRVAHSKRDCHE